MYKDFFSRVIMVIIVALLGTMFLAPSIAFGANATEVPEATVNYDETFAELERMGFKFTIYDVEEDGIDIMNEHDNIAENELIIIFNVGKNYDIFWGENINEKFTTPVKWEISHLWMERGEWKNKVISEHVSRIYDEISKALAAQNSAKNQNVNSYNGFKGLVVSIYNWSLENPLNALIIVLAIIAMCLIWNQLCKLVKALWFALKALYNVVKAIFVLLVKIFKGIGKFARWVHKLFTKKHRR